MDAFEANTTRVDQFLALTKKYTDFSVLTTPMIYEFVDKIFVHAPDRSTGDRTQEVDIYLKFIGKFDVPLPEPTAEELAEMKSSGNSRLITVSVVSGSGSGTSRRSSQNREKVHNPLRGLAMWQVPYEKENDFYEYQE